MFWVLRTRDDAARENVAYLVTQIGCEIEYYPDINPTVGFFVAIKLGSINRKCDDRIVVFDFASLDGIEIIRAAEDIVVDVVFASSTLLQKIPSLVPTIAHILSHLGTTPTRLKLWTEWKRCEDLLGDLFLA